MIVHQILRRPSRPMTAPSRSRRPSSAGPGALGRQGRQSHIGVMARKRNTSRGLQRRWTSPMSRAVLSISCEPRNGPLRLPGLPALNFVLHHALGGGGVASLRNDPQAKVRTNFIDTPVSLRNVED